MAQDVETVLPELVGNVRFETALANPHPTEAEVKASKTIMYKALNYTELIPIIIKGMQEQQQVIEQQQQQILELKKDLSDLKALVMNKPNNSTAALSSVQLEQNTPNPFMYATTIHYSVPTGSHRAAILITDYSGKLIKSIPLNVPGEGSIKVDASTLASGIYNYSVAVDGKVVDTKKMTINR